MENIRIKKPFLETKKEQIESKENEQNKNDSNKTDEDSTIYLLSAIGNNIRNIREIRKITMKELAKKSSLSENYLSYIERGMQNLTVNKMENIAKALSLDADLFLYKNMEASKILKIFELRCKLHNYSYEILIDIEIIIERFEHIILEAKKIELSNKKEDN